MSASKKKNVTPSQEEYQELAKKHEHKRPIFKNCLRAFFIGGLICVIGQGIEMMYYTFFDFTEETARNPTVATLIFVAVLLTGFGVYDRIAQFSGAGTAVPVTGFANSISSAAIEHRTEGYVLGVGGNMFKLAGSVIVFGTVAAFVIAIIKTVFMNWGGM